MKKRMYGLLCILLLLTAGCNSTKAIETAKTQIPQTTEISTKESTKPEVTPVPETESDTKPKMESLSLVMVGDVLLHTPVSDSGKQEDGSYNYDHLFRHVKDRIQGADIAMVNQEVILGGRELGLSGYPSFNGAYEVGDALVNSGFDVVCHATNHALDKGEKGVRNCLDFWKTKYPRIQVTGINCDQNAQDNQIAVIEKNHIKIAVLNYTYGTNGINPPPEAPYLVNYMNREKIKRDVELAGTQADFIVICPHWGIEYQHQPSKEQKELAQYFADLGVDLVIGTHPHVIEPVEWVKGQGGNHTLVYYSLGNFVNATSGTGDGVADRMLGEMAEVTITKGEDENVGITGYDAVPIVSHLKSGIGGITVYPLTDYTKELASENEIMNQDSHFSLDYLNALWEDMKVTENETDFTEF